MSSAAPKIKFCGVTSVADAEQCVSAGAWAVGINLWPHSVRYVEPPRAAQIAQALRRRAEVAGVFVNPTLDEVAWSAETIGLTMIQLHGDEGPAFCAEVGRRTGCRVIKAVRVRSGADIQALAPFATDFHLLDAYVDGQPGGTGRAFAWELARAHLGTVPLILSGGLTAENVAEAIATVRPFAVDVASGVERSPGVKHAGKLKAFAAAVAGAHAPRPPAVHARPGGWSHATTRT